MKINNKTILTAITSSGKLTIGNYIGALKNIISLQNENKLFLFVADLHSLTSKISPEELRNNKKLMVALFLSLGIDRKKVIIFFQSDISEHSELFWILANLTYFGELKRMIQFKEKSKKNLSTNVGLFTYPVLMASDILLYKCDYVPIGEDQKQHLELTINLAKRFNTQYGEVFKIPKIIFNKNGSKIRSLTNPNEKMSKSSKYTNSYISLLDNPNDAYKKIIKSVTDSENKVYYDLTNKPGISNLLSIYCSLKNIPIKEGEKTFKNKNYLEFKKSVGNIVKNFLENIQTKLKVNLDKVQEVITQGKKDAKEIASKTLEQVKLKAGLI